MGKRGLEQPPLRIGSFEVVERIGKGGMGEVWRGVHVREGLPVAVKVVTPSHAREPAFVEAFRDEVRAVAALAHPGIVTVLDYGEVSEQAQTASGGILVAGAPYLAMELLPRGSLRALPLPLPFARLREILGTLLQALAHAHARGVIHRDLKPENVLLAGEGAAPAVKLTDFGIAHAVERHRGARTREQALGTPTYMAPEQIQGRFREYGPWTDLYALGCLAFELATGAPPFAGSGIGELVVAHMTAVPRVPPMEGRAPRGFDAWLLRLLEKPPERRFRWAADAAFELEGLVGDDRGPEVGTSAAPAADTLASGEALEAETQTIALDAPPEWGAPDRGSRNSCPPPHGHLRAPRPSSTAAACPRHASGFVGPIRRGADRDPTGPYFRCPCELPPIRSTVPPIPVSYVRPVPAVPSMRLVGAGLGLYSLRTLPLVDREQERARVWGALREVAEDGRPRLVELRGGSGTGKSRLARWICERAHEVGAASVLVATHGPVRGPSDGVAGMVARHLRCVGLPAEKVPERIARALSPWGAIDPHEVRALADLVCPSDVSESRATPAERHAVVSRLLGRLAEERPVVVVIEDAQWGPDAVTLATQLVAAEHHAPLPVLVILTVNDQHLPEAAQACSELDDLTTRPDAQRIPVGPLAGADHARLVRDLLSLDGALAEQVERRTDGNPLFAVQLVGDWVARGVLVPGERGFVLRSEGEAVIPDDIHAVWASRVERAVTGLAEPARWALEVASALGLVVDAGEWAAACGVQASTLDLLTERLLANSLARTAIGGEGWAFGHNLLRESLERTAREAGRWAAANEACALMLERLPSGGIGGVEERRGLHLLQAGLALEATRPLLDGAEARLGRSEHREARELLDKAERALGGAAVPEDDARWGRLWELRSRVYRCLVDVDNFALFAKRALEAAERHGWAKVRAQALSSLGGALGMRGEFDEARVRLQAAREAYAGLGDARGAAEAQRLVGICARNLGDPEAAMEELQAALGEMIGLGDGRGEGLCLCAMADIAANRGLRREARGWYERGMALLEAGGDLLRVAIAVNGLADVDRYEGALEAAEAGYRKALALHERIAAGGAVPRSNLALLLLERGRYAEAREALLAVRDEFERSGRTRFLGNTNAQLLACDAAAGDFEAWDEHMAEARRLLSRSSAVERDIAWPLGLAGELATAAGEEERARGAFELALAQWRAIGDEGRVAEVEAALAVNRR